MLIIQLYRQTRSIVQTRIINKTETKKLPEKGLKFYDSANVAAYFGCNNYLCSDFRIEIICGPRIFLPNFEFRYRLFTCNLIWQFQIFAYRISSFWFYDFRCKFCRTIKNIGSRYIATVQLNKCQANSH